MEDPENVSNKRMKTENPKILAEEVFLFQVAHPVELVSTEYDFCPVYTYQTFGDDEEIIGYTNPRVVVHLNLSSYETFLDFQYDERFGECTDVTTLVKEAFASGMHTSISEFEDSFKKTKLTNLDKLNVVEIDNPSSSASLVFTTLKDARNDLKVIHSNAQQLLQFYVEAASCIDQDDPNWLIIFALKKVGDEYILVGFCTMYKFYAFPEKSKVRVSQVFVIPPFQKQGIGKHMLQAVYKLAITEDYCDIKIHVPVVQLLREKIELDLALKLPWIVELAEKASCSVQESATSTNYENLLISNANLTKLASELRIPKSQACGLWECLLIQHKTFQNGNGAAVLKQYLRAIFENRFADLQDHAKGKVIVDVPDTSDWFMCKSKKIPLPAQKENVMPDLTSKAGVEKIKEAMESEQLAKEKEDAHKRVLDSVEARFSTLFKLIVN